MSDGPSRRAVTRAGDAPEIFVADEQDAVAVDAEHLTRLAAAVLREERVRTPSELAIYFVDAAVMADLNERFMGVEEPTDVLAFPIDDDAGEVGRSPDAGTTGPDRGGVESTVVPLLLGDVFVCPPVAASNARAQGTDVADELALLVVHGILHVLGMDHAEEEEAAIMQRRERELLARHHRAR